MADPDLGLTGAEGGDLGAPKSRHFGDIKARFSVDDKGLKDLNTHFVKLNAETDKFYKRLPDLTKRTKSWADELERAAAAMGQASAGSAVDGYKNPIGKVQAAQAAAGTGTSYTNYITPAAPGAAAAGGGGSTWDRMRTSLADAGGRGTARAAVGATALAAVGGAIGAMDNRINSAYGTMLSMDQLGNVFRQQNAGMSQLQYQAQYRDPLAQFNLGTMGANDLLAIQARTGINMAGVNGQVGQGASVEAMRRATGWSMTAAQGGSIIEQMASPQVNNRLFQMLGTGIYGPGGVERPVEDVFQDIIRRTGLNNPAMAEAAMRPGSRMRARLADFGLTPEMTDMVIQQANQQGPGGGPRNRTMGDSFATAHEETLTAQNQREEQFYRNQIDNYETLADRTKDLIVLFGELEKQLSGIVGVGVSSSSIRGGLGGWAKKGLGALMVVGGAKLSATGVGALAGVPLMAAGADMVMSGDAVASGAAGPTTNSGGAVTPDVPKNLAGAVTTESWQKMHTNMKQRLIKMFKDNPSLSFGNGYRSPALQRQMFLSRHRVDPNGKISFEGKRWSRLPGYPATAAPGRSMHEIGLAADIGPKSQYGWIVANASRYGFQVGTSFGEPWHIQPAELPMSRSRYEAAGAAWGTAPGGSEGGEEYQPSANLEDTTDVSEREGAPEQTGGGGGMFMATGSSISETLEALYTTNQGMIGMSAAMSTGGSVSSGASQGNVVHQAGGSGSFPEGTTMTGEQVAKLAAAKGLRGDNLAKAIAIAYGESRFNPNATGDVSLQNNKWGPSLGLWQVRSLNAERGKGTTRDATRLKDPTFNANSMYEISGGGQNWKPWSVYTGGIYQQHMGAAKTSMQNAGVAGDAVADPVGGGGGASKVSVSGGNQITIAPQIHLQGAGSTSVDAQRIATEVIRLIRSSSAVEALRRS